MGVTSLFEDIERRRDELAHAASRLADAVEANDFAEAKATIEQSTVLLERVARLARELTKPKVDKAAQLVLLSYNNSKLEGKITNLAQKIEVLNQRLVVECDLRAKCEAPLREEIASLRRRLRPVKIAKSSKKRKQKVKIHAYAVHPKRARPRRVAALRQSPTAPGLGGKSVREMRKRPRQKTLAGRQDD